MGAYINPPDKTKEQWLKEHATWIPGPPAWEMVPAGHLPVCLVDNYRFTAAGIAFDEAELAEFARPDTRPRQWYMARKEELLKVSNLAQYLR